MTEREEIVAKLREEFDLWQGHLSSLNERAIASSRLPNGWSIKELHQLILTSDTWRQSSVHPQIDSYASIDPENREAGLVDIQMGPMSGRGEMDQSGSFTTATFDFGNVVMDVERIWQSGALNSD